MKNKVVWIGTKESDILHTNHFFSNSITACGSGKSHNVKANGNGCRKRF